MLRVERCSNAYFVVKRRRRSRFGKRTAGAGCLIAAPQRQKSMTRGPEYDPPRSP